MTINKALPVILAGVVLSTGIATASAVNNRKSINVPVTEPAVYVAVEYRYYDASDDIKARIKAWEGYTAYAKDDAGVPAYGYGHRDKSIHIGDYCSPEMAEELFAVDIRKVEDGVRKFEEANGIKFTWYEFDALVSFMYNFGTSYLNAGFGGSDLGRLIVQYKNGLTDADAVFDEWIQYCHYKDTDGIKKTSTGLYNRRVVEAGRFFAHG